jgi:hypothetical protein
MCCASNLDADAITTTTLIDFECFSSAFLVLLQFDLHKPEIIETFYHLVELVSGPGLISAKTSPISLRSPFVVFDWLNI